MNTPTFGYTYGERLEYVRNDHNLTIKAMAASVNVSPSTWRKYEKDESFPSPSTIWTFCGIYHVDENWLNTSEGEIYTDGYKPGDELGKPISYEQKLLNDLMVMRGRGGVSNIIFSAGGAEEKLNGIIADLQDIQDRVAELSDELDEDDLEDAEGEIDVVIDMIGDVIEKHGWKVR